MWGGCPKNIKVVDKIEQIVPRGLIQGILIDVFGRGIILLSWRD
jgi:hypothetical protein